MKKILLLPLQFILTLLGTLFVLSGIRILWLYSFNAGWIGQQITSEPFLFFIAVIVDVLLPALVITWFVLMFRILHLQKFRYGAIFLHSILWAASFFAFSTIANSLPSISMMSIPIQKPDLPGSSILKYENGHILRIKSQGDIPIRWYLHEDTPGSLIQSVEDLRISEDGSSLLVPEKGLTIALSSLDPAAGKHESGWFMVEWFIDSFTGIRASLSSTVKTLPFLQILLWSLAFSFALHSLWFFIRMTRWPLFNFFLSVSMIFVLFQLAAWLSKVQNMANFSFLPEQLLVFVGPMVLTLFGLFFWSLNLFLPTVKDWKREVGL